MKLLVVFLLLLLSSIVAQEFDKSDLNPEISYFALSSFDHYDISIARIKRLMNIPSEVDIQNLEELKKRIELHELCNQRIKELMRFKESLDSEKLQACKKGISETLDALFNLNAALTAPFPSVFNSYKGLKFNQIFEDEELFNFWINSSYGYYAYEVKSFLKEDCDGEKFSEEKMKKIKLMRYHILSYWSFSELYQHGFDTFKTLAEEINSFERAELRHFWGEVILHHLISWAVFFDPTHHALLVAHIESDIAHYQGEYLMNAQNFLAQVKADPKFLDWEKILAFIQQHAARVDFEAMKAAVKADLKNDYRWRNTVFREGDIFLEADPDGFGTMFNQILGIKSFITHSGLISRGYYAGWQYYYVSAIFQGFDIYSIPRRFNDISCLFMRTKLPIEAFSTDKANRNVEKRKFYFDAFCQDGVYDEEGNAVLYCGEYIDKIFTTGLSPTGEKIGESPFDTIRIKLHPVLKANLQKIGADVSYNWYFPDELLYSSKLEYQSLASNDSDYLKKGNEETVSKLDHELLFLLHSNMVDKEFSSPGFVETWLIKLISWYFQDSEELRKLKIADENRVPFLRMHLVYFLFSSHIDNIRDEMKELTPEEFQERVDNFNSWSYWVYKPMTERLFETSYLDLWVLLALIVFILLVRKGIRTVKRWWRNRRLKKLAKK